MDAWINLIANTGFPIALSCWFLFRLEKTIKNNTIAMAKNSVALNRIEKVIQKLS